MQYDEIEELLKLLSGLFGAAGIPISATKALYEQIRTHYKEDPGVRSIERHLKDGGKLENIEVYGVNEYNRLKQLMEDSHVSYISTAAQVNDGSTKYIFFYKDIDKTRVNKMSQAIENEFSNNSKELDIYSFKNLMRGKEIASADNLSLDEVYAFRSNLSDCSLKLCVVSGSEPDTFKIYTDNKQEMIKALVKVSYDLARNDGGVFHNEVRDFISKREALLERLGDKEPLVIADAKNPGKFIYLDKDSYSCHTFVSKDETDIYGNKVTVVKDEAVPFVHKPLEKSDVLRAASEMARPVILSASSFGLLKEVNKNGVAFASEDIKEKMEQFVSAYENEAPVITPFPRPKPLYTAKNVFSYSHVPSAVLDEMAKELDFVCISGNCVSFDISRRKEVDDFLQDKVLDKLPDDLSRRAFMWQIEGRCGDFRPDFSTDVKEPFYIINPDKPDFTVRIDSDAIHIFENGHETRNCPSYDENYMKFLAVYTAPEMMANPVVLTEAEMESTERVNIINERANRSAPNEAQEKLINLEETEKQQLYSMAQIKDERIDINHNGTELSPTQDKASESLQKQRVRATVLNNSVFADIQRENTNREMTVDMDI